MVTIGWPQTKMWSVVGPVDRKCLKVGAAVPECLSNLQLKLMSVLCAQGRAACSHTPSQEGCGFSLWRAGMTSVGVGCVT